MDIYLIRHADALALGERGITEDEDRPLSERGEAQARALGAGLQGKGIRLEKIVTSPLVRARKTADAILHSWQEPVPEVHVCGHLAPDGKCKKLAKFLRGLGSETIALIGHQPHLGLFLAWLIGGKKAQIDLAKTGVACLSCAEPGKGTATLRFLVSPDWWGT